MKIEKKTKIVKKMVEVESEETNYLLTLNADEIRAIRGLIGNVKTYEQGEVGKIIEDIRRDMYGICDPNFYDGSRQFLTNAVILNFTDLETLRKTYSA